MANRVFFGTIINPSPSMKNVDIIENGCLVAEGSKIISVGYASELGCCDLDKHDVTQLSSSQFLIPGLIDAHIHAPQYPNMGMGYDLSLLEWLNKYTYKLESTFVDLEFSRRVYNAVVQKTLAFGTTTACYFASMYLNSSKELVNAAIHYGQRAFVGKINMTRLAPPEYVETAEASVRDTEAFIQHVLATRSEIVKPIITPRFALSVDMQLMQKMAHFAAEYDVNIQTHIAENRDEVAMVKELYPDAESYTDVYRKAGLLTFKTVLAHGIYLSEAEMKVLAAKGTSIAHCPNSNIRLKSGFCNVRLLQKNGVNVALGTDVAGGCSPSVIDAMRSAIDVSSYLTSAQNSFQPLTHSEAFCLATLGGARALAIDDQVGILQAGKQFDAIVVEMRELIGDHGAAELFEKFVYLADDRNVQSVFVGGRRVK